MTDRDLVDVRATIHLPGLAVGDVAKVDPTDEYMAAALAAGHLVPLRSEKDEDRAPDIPADDGPVADEDETDAVAPPVT